MAGTEYSQLLDCTNGFGTVIFLQLVKMSGLVLYWMVSNVLAILHQLWIGRRMRAQGAT